MIKRILLCADDYAQNQDISMGILTLCQQQRINAVSSLVNAPLWAESSEKLLPLKTTHYLGLHFNLTWGRALSAEWQACYGKEFKGLTWLLKQCYGGRLDKRSVEAEIQAQIQAYTAALGEKPDFFDGHQHIQQLPIIRDIIGTLYTKSPFAPLLRNTCNGGRDLVCRIGFPKKQLIAVLGGWAFKQQLKQLKMPTNTSFAGIYNFAKAKHYRSYFRHFLAISQDAGLIMCHPGLPSVDQSDPLSAFRHEEMNYLMSDIFWQDLRDYGYELMFKATT